MNESITIRAGGKTYTLNAGKNPEHTRRVAKYVQRRVSEIQAATLSDDMSALLLTAVNLGDELLRAQEEIRRMREELTKLRGVK